MQRSYITYTSIYNIISDIHSMVDSVDWDEDKMLEWAVKGLRKLNIPAKYEDVVVMLKVTNHSTQLPDDIKYINQMFYTVSNDLSYEQLIGLVNESLGISEDKANYYHMAYPDNLAKQILNAGYFNRWFRPLRRESGSFGTEPCTFNKVPNTRQCNHRYTIYGKQSIQTTFPEGCVLLSYKRYVRDCDGIDLVPDNEDLKDALFHFCMYRWWMSRMTYKEEGSQGQMQFHLQQYMMLGKKAAANLTSPDIDQLENIKDTRNRLVPREYFYDKGFGQLSNRENIDF
jgi:hypothetical protein